MASLFTKTFVSAALLCAVGASHALAKLPPPPPPPPPPSISNINQYGVTDERLWNKDKAAEVRGVVHLTADREVRGLHIYEPDQDHSWLNLNGKSLVVGREGILHYSYEKSIIAEGGFITSSESLLRVSLMRSSQYALHIKSIITDNSMGKLSLVVSGAHPEGYSYLSLDGSQSNTFSGDVTVVGRNGLALQKTHGATAVNGNIHLQDGARLGLYLGGNQIADSSTVTLSGKNSMIHMARQAAESISEAFHKLLVLGTGAIYFERGGGKDTFPHGQRHLYLDDLEIQSEGSLLVRFWKEGRDHILVRRDSEHLAESLKRIQFEGYDPNAVHLEDYDENYWEINAMPEPATYGAGLMLGALGLTRYRRFQKRRCTKQQPLAVG